MRRPLQFDCLLHPLAVIVLTIGLSACVPPPERWDANYLAENYSCSDFIVLSRRLARERAEAGGNTAWKLRSSRDPLAQWSGRELDRELDARFQDREVPLRQAKAQKKC